ncbi:MAG TPA: hypothetical protein VM681_07430 [Candidatus Thermoplasmatota archaeon]|nr:hypothetical protein [Candidatus Thermoplasmatota archaeon]
MDSLPRWAAAWCAVLLALPLAGCLDGDRFLAETRILASVDVGSLTPGTVERHAFDVPAGLVLLYVAEIAGRRPTTHVLLESPTGERFDSRRLSPSPAECAVESPSAGPWTLEVRVDPADVPFGPARFVVRGGPTLPGLFPCRNETFPGLGVPVVLARMGGVSVNETTSPPRSTFEVPAGLSLLDARVTPDAQNVTLLLQPPEGSPQQAPVHHPVTGTWTFSIRAAHNSTANLTNATIHVFGQR